MTSIGDILHVVCIGDILHVTSIGDILHVTSIGDILHVTSIGDILHVTSIGDILHVTSIGDILHVVCIGNILHVTSIGDILQVISTGDIPQIIYKWHPISDIIQRKSYWWPAFFRDNSFNPWVSFQYNIPCKWTWSWWKTTKTISKPTFSHISTIDTLCVCICMSVLNGESACI